MKKNRNRSVHQCVRNLGCCFCTHSWYTANYIHWINFSTQVLNTCWNRTLSETCHMPRFHLLACKIQLWISFLEYLKLLSTILRLLLEQLLTAISHYVYHVHICAARYPELMKQIVTLNSKQICLRMIQRLIHFTIFVNSNHHIPLKLLNHWNYYACKTKLPTRITVTHCMHS